MYNYLIIQPVTLRNIAYVMWDFVVVRKPLLAGQKVRYCILYSGNSLGEMADKKVDEKGLKLL